MLSINVSSYAINSQLCSRRTFFTNFTLFLGPNHHLCRGLAKLPNNLQIHFFLFFCSLPYSSIILGLRSTIITKFIIELGVLVIIHLPPVASVGEESNSRAILGLTNANSSKYTRGPNHVLYFLGLLVQ